MANPLSRHINGLINIPKDEAIEISYFFSKKSHRKKDDLLKVGERCNAMFFVNKGCLYMYTIDEQGTEKTIQFAIENWWLTDILAFRNQCSSQFGIRAALESEVMEITFSAYRRLLTLHPEMEKYFRNVNEIAYGAALMRLKYLFTHSKEDIFHHFNSSFPDFVNRVPQYLLASYLNLTPEYLSQIRRKVWERGDGGL
jgi:CRP-like cAMP-binding protein